MPEAPQMQALSERIGDWLAGATFEGYDPLGFTGLKTYEPPPEALIGATLVGVDRRAKYDYAASVLFAVQPLVQAEFHRSDADFGLLTTAFFWCYMIAAPLTGPLADRINRCGIMVVGAALWSAFTLLTAITHSFHVGRPGCAAPDHERWAELRMQQRYS